jgi:hypothetical protein
VGYSERVSLNRMTLGSVLAYGLFAIAAGAWCYATYHFLGFMNAARRSGALPPFPPLSRPRRFDLVWMMNNADRVPGGGAQRDRVRWALSIFLACCLVFLVVGASANH